MTNRTSKILDAAQKTAKDYSFFEKIPILFRLIKQWKNGNFKLNASNKWMIILGLIYIISPIDLIPGDLLNIVGLTDDLAVIAIVFSRLNKEIENFLRWENTQNNTIDTEVIIT